MEKLAQDLKYALRMLARNPAFSAAAILCLMLGIGATTAIFSVVNAVLLRPLPYAQPASLVRVYTEFPNFPNGGLRRFWASPPEFFDLRRDTRSWASLDAWAINGANIAGLTQPARVTVANVSGGMLSTLGVNPVIGRVIAASDDDPGAPIVADISYGLWQSLFGGARDVIGNQTLLDGQKCAIIGVMPRSFQFPPGELDPPQVWTPLQLDPAHAGSRGSHFLNLLGRLKPGVTAAQAQSELVAYETATGRNASPKTHVFNTKTHTLVSFPLQAEVVSGVRPALLMLLGAVCFVLLIACVNVANLLLARAEARRREIAIRSTLGAALPRLARQFITEGILLSLFGAVLGLALAFGGLRLIQLTNAGALPRATEISIDLRVLLVTLIASLLTGALFGLAPILPLIFQNLQSSLKDTGGAAISSRAAAIFRFVLVAGEMAAALALLIACGLLVRGFWKLQEVNTGLNPRNVITMSISLPSGTYPKLEQDNALWGRLEERITHLPGIESAALVTGLPPQRPPNMNDTTIEGFVPVPNGPIQNVDFYQAVSKDYFQTMGIRLIEGRWFDDRDAHGAPLTAVINQAMAHTFWPRQDPVGRRLQPGGTKDWVTVIGIVEDVKNAGLDRSAGTELYLPYRQLPENNGPNNIIYAVLRAQGDPRPLANAVRREVRELDPALPVAQVKTMDDVLSDAQSRPRFLTLLLTLFSSLALVIATVGIYGVISYSVARRSKEFGLRMALGAQQQSVLFLVLKQAALLTLYGIAAGLLAALFLTRLMSTLLIGVRPTDPITYITVSALLAIVALAASYFPARRATEVDPIEALRYE